MKRTLALLLGVLFALGAAMSVPAEESMIELPEMGLACPGDFQPETDEGICRLVRDGVISLSPYTAAMEFVYEMTLPEGIQAEGNVPPAVPVGLCAVTDGTAEEAAALLRDMCPADFLNTPPAEFGGSEGFRYLYWKIGSACTDAVLNEYAARTSVTFANGQITEWKEEADFLGDACLEALRAFQQTKIDPLASADPMGSILNDLFLRAALGLDAKTEDTDASAVPNEAGIYRVYVFDGDKPVPGAVIQFCSDTLCMMGQTDENGLAAFDQPEGEYTVHVLVAPEGYEADGQEYRPLRVHSDLRITLTPKP